MPVSDRTRLATLKARVTTPSSIPETRPASLRHGVRGFELPQDLRFAHHHGIQAGRHAEQVMDGLAALAIVEMPRHRRGARGFPVAQKRADDFPRVIAVGRRYGDLHAVAGGKDQRFLHAVARLKVRQRLRQRFLAEGEPLPHFHGRRLVAHAGNQELHGLNRMAPSRACAAQVKAEKPTTTTVSTAAFRPRHPAVTRRNTSAR